MRGKRPFYFLVFAAAPLLFFLQFPNQAEILRQTSLTLLKPLLAASYALTRTLREGGEVLNRFWSLYQTEEELAQRVEALERELVEKEELRKENERLRQLLEFKKEIPGKAIPARVVGRDLVPWRKTILIDKGARDGVEKRMIIVNAQGLVGRVIEVAPLSARAILLLDPESRVSVIFQETRDTGIAEGNGSAGIRVTHIDRESSVKVGERVLSSGLGEVYPKGIPVGEVEMMGTEKEGLELFALVRPSVNFSKLEEVLCIASFQPGS